MAAVYSLAFESDSTRIVTLMVDAFKTFVFALPIQKATIESYHGLWFEHRRGDLRQADRHRHRAVHHRPGMLSRSLLPVLIPQAK